MRRGFILIWSGSYETIPDGWALCDGNNGTPDLVDRVPVGAGLSYAPYAFGSDKEHGHLVALVPHHHIFPPGALCFIDGDDYAPETEDKTITGIAQLTSNLPPYAAYYYIMKL